MNIGEKIRELRLAKLMTQSELVGTRITRNMLSCIENGTAQPSLSTILYIAGRLNVPAGFLLAEEGDEGLYRKMNSFSNIKTAYTAGDLWGCRNLCLSGCPEPDDEISLILAECDAGIAADEYRGGRLRSSCRFFDEALEYAAKTMYRTERIELTARTYFRAMQRVSATLYSDVLDDGFVPGIKDQSPFALYLDAMDAADEGRTADAERDLGQLEPSSFYALHLKATLLLREGNLTAAEKILRGMLGGENPLVKPELYAVFADLEVCCREAENYKEAYSFANEKIQLLEELLKEV